MFFKLLFYWIYFLIFTSRVNHSDLARSSPSSLQELQKFLFVTKWDWSKTKNKQLLKCTKTFSYFKICDWWLTLTMEWDHHAWPTGWESRRSRPFIVKFSDIRWSVVFSICNVNANIISSSMFTIWRIEPLMAYVLYVPVMTPRTGSTSAMLSWMEAWSRALMMRLLAEL